MSTSSTARQGAGTAGWETRDLAIEHNLSLLSDSLQFLREVSPDDAEEKREAFLAGVGEEPEFTYREPQVDLEVLSEQIDLVPLDEVTDPTLAALLRRRIHEMRVQVEMLRMRGTSVFRDFSVELYGDVSDDLYSFAQHVVDDLEVPDPPQETVGAEALRDAAEAEIARYRAVDPRLRVHTELRPDFTGVALLGDRLLISTAVRVQQHRLTSLVHHELSTHLATQVNAVGQPLRTLRTGLARFDETHEGLAVLGELAAGVLTPFRLRELAVRALTVHRMLEGATFREAFTTMTDVGVPEAAAYNTCVRVYRCGGLTKDAGYLRGALNLLEHVRSGEGIDLLLLGKFSLDDLPAVTDLHRRGLLGPVRATPDWMDLPDWRARVRAAATAPDLCSMTSPPPGAVD
ncbi:tyrosine/phenylalanine carboxypeptidase domain-containing protein [Kytococcus sp. Marseille-QA3725]